jgi:hypothetical protein
MNYKPEEVPIKYFSSRKTKPVRKSLKPDQKLKLKEEKNKDLIKKRMLIKSINTDI